MNKKKDEFPPLHKIVFTRVQIEAMLDKVILQILRGIIEYKSREGFDVRSISDVRSIEHDTPFDFQERFFLLMDIVYPCIEYAKRFIKREHPEALYLFNWFCKLYIEDVSTTSSPVDIKDIE